MSPDSAKVVIFEDDPDWQRRIEMALSRGGHSVVAIAQTPEEALNLVPNLKSLGVQVAVVDANLRLKDTSGTDGRLIVEAIRKQTPEVVTIGMATFDFPETKVDLTKGELRKLAGIITEL